MSIKNIYLYSNNSPKSQEAMTQIRRSMAQYEFNELETYSDKVDLVVAVGGDGAFINAVQTTGFNRNIPYIGVHTGHLGFLQEINVEDIENTFKRIRAEQYRIDNLSVEDITIHFEKPSGYLKHEPAANGYRTHTALNEMIIREKELKTMRLDIFVNGNLLEDFAGDGVCISTPTGSTAINKSAGGSIIYPGINSLQIAPLLPINSAAFRSLACGVVVPQDMTITLVPKEGYADRLLPIIDGDTLKDINNVKQITITTSQEGIKALRFDKFNFWTRINEKFL